MKLPDPISYLGSIMENGELVTYATRFKGNIYLFTLRDIYVIKNPSWLFRKWTKIKARFQRWWDVGWEIPQ